MKKITIGLLVYLFVSTVNAAIVTIEHNISNLPPSGFFTIDLDDDGLTDINLASNFYVAVSSGYPTEFTSSYSLLGDSIDVNTPWRRGNTWPSSSGYVQDGLLYLGTRNTTIGDYYGYITFDYHSDSNSVSLNSYTYENTGSAITVGATTVPEPAAAWLFGSGLVGLIGMVRRRAA